MISPFGPTGANCLIPPPKRLPTPAALMIQTGFVIVHPILAHISKYMIPASAKIVNREFCIRIVETCKKPARARQGHCQRRENVVS